MDTLGACHAF
jgi:hypothetical protein